jgi:cytochrome P450
MNLAELDITSTRRYASEGYPWAAWDVLRREAPVHWCEPPDYDPFWAITRHADVLTISKRPDVFSNSGRPSLTASWVLQRGVGISRTRAWQTTRSTRSTRRGSS